MADKPIQQCRQAVSWTLLVVINKLQQPKQNMYQHQYTSILAVVKTELKKVAQKITANQTLFWNGQESYQAYAWTVLQYSKCKNVTTGSTLISFCAYMLTRLTGTNNELKAESNHTRCLYKQLDSVNCKEHQQQQIK